MRMVFIALVVLALSGVADGQMGTSSAASQAEDAKVLAKAQREYDSAKALFHRHPTPGNRHLCVVATDRYALTAISDGSLGPKIKYRQALRLYREALKLEPTNVEAKNNSDYIISIYKSMHRPVPQ
jgi:hypothetical protein